MPDVRVGADPQAIEPDDMAAILCAIEVTGFTAEPGDAPIPEPQEPSASHGRVIDLSWWWLALEWIGAVGGVATFVDQLGTVTKRVRDHYRKAGRQSPARVVVHGEDGKILGQVEIPENER
jgi:hypothetical protein